MYVKGGSRALYEKARQMKLKIPNLKVLAFLCDPIKRLYSHISMEFLYRPTFWGQGATMESVWQTAESYANSEPAIKASKDTLVDKLTIGRYYSKISPWIEMFGFDRIHLVDGENLGKSYELLVFTDFQPEFRTFGSKNENYKK